MKRIQFLILSLATLLFACERDDICAATTTTTPRLVIEFYDDINNDDLKSVSRLTVYGEGLISDPEESTDETLVFNTNTNQISLPLIVGTENELNTSRFILEKDTNLRLNDNNATNSNIDILEISYTTEFVYVSRACGYKSQFIGLSLNVEADSDLWISNIEIVETTVQDENTVHVRIFH
ncbi:DUF6452 family protein [Winogradskyella sp. A2]|uniref:DUF6452 family protein n=1 Tax=Winogradskyella sp. A2 TaxID=3366944 RepID=UPI00398C387D